MFLDWGEDVASSHCPMPTAQLHSWSVGRRYLCVGWIVPLARSSVVSQLQKARASDQLTSLAGLPGRWGFAFRNTAKCESRVSVLATRSCDAVAGSGWALLTMGTFTNAMPKLLLHAVFGRVAVLQALAVIAVMMRATLETGGMMGKE